MFLQSYKYRETNDTSESYLNVKKLIKNLMSTSWIFGSGNDAALIIVIFNHFYTVYPDSPQCLPYEFMTNQKWTPRLVVP